MSGNCCKYIESTIEETYSKIDDVFYTSIVDESIKDFNKINNDYFICFNKYKIENKSSNFLEHVMPCFKRKDVNRALYIKEILEEGVISYLKNLSNIASIEYLRFIEVAWDVDHIVGKYGSDKLYKLIEKKYKSILSSGELIELKNTINHGVQNVLTGDVYKLGIQSNRNKFGNLIFYLLLTDGTFFKILSGEKYT